MVHSIRIGDIFKPLMFWRRGSTDNNSKKIDTTSLRDVFIHKLESHIEELMTENNQLRESNAFLKRNVQYHKDYSLRLRKEKIALSNSIETIRSETIKEMKVSFAEEQKTLIAEVKSSYELDLATLRKELKDSKNTLKQLKSELNTALQGKQQSDKKVIELKSEIKDMQKSYEASLQKASTVKPVAKKERKNAPVTAKSQVVPPKKHPSTDYEDEEEVPRRSRQSGNKKPSPKIAPKRRK